MNFIKGFIIVAASWLLQSCFDSNDHIFDEADSVEISIDATLSTSMAVPNPSIKADTFNVGDTIYFLTTIVPNKIIRVQDYHWLMDGEYCSSEYNFKRQINKPGHHKFKFVLKDYFGDMHYDSVDVWIAGNPTINESEFIPAAGTQAIAPYEAIYFAWSSYTEGIKLSHKYRFTLSEQSYANSSSKFKDIDIVLDEPHYTFHNKLNPFKKYNWTVQSFNEFGYASAEKIEGYFYTKGLAGEGSLNAVIESSQDAPVPIHLTLQNKKDSTKVIDYKFTPSKVFNEISLGAIPAGKYKLSVKSDYPDFSSTKTDVVINDGFVTVIEGLKLTDETKPSIASISGLDTLDFADTLKFIIKDGGGSLPSPNITASLESKTITNKFFRDSVLTVILDETEKSWAYRILTVTATDESGNKSSKSFYIKPSTLWFDTNSDTTITSNGTITLFIKDLNPYGFKVDSLKFFNVTKNTTIISVLAIGLDAFNAELEANLFDETQTIRSTILYTNGLTQSKDWTLNVTPISTKEDEE